MQFIGDDDKIPMWKRDNYGNAIKSAFQVKFQCGIEIICGNAI